TLFRAQKALDLVQLIGGDLKYPALDVGLDARIVAAGGGGLTAGRRRCRGRRRRSAAAAARSRRGTAGTEGSAVEDVFEGALWIELADDRLTRALVADTVPRIGATVVDLQVDAASRCSAANHGRDH